jgi:2-phosphoglycerate kinase
MKAILLTHPKVLILGGPPMIGKSSVARIIASRLGYGCVSTDDIGLAMKSVTNAQTHPHLHAMDGIDYREYYITRSADDLLTECMGTHEEMWTGVEAVIRAHADWSFPIVFEGWAMWPERVAGLLAELDNVAAVWLTAYDELLEARVRGAERFYKGASDQEMMIQKFLPRNIDYNLRMMNPVGRLGLAVVEVTANRSTEQLAAECLQLLNT